ncbi:hypothetical protein ACKKBG_A30615 [Auxenochlorella protothecoides x Auxenochlorella symbiontica]
MVWLGETLQKLGSAAVKMAQNTSRNNKSTIFEVSYLGLSLLGSWLILRWALKQMDPTKKNVETAKQRKKALSKRLGRPVNTDGQYEDVIAQEVVNPAHINITLQDVGGLDHIIEDLQRNVITPMRRPELFRTSLLRQKRGVLLYGPPGTGKTMLAKALASECNACFINLKASTLLSKWYGDTNKLIAAVWSLAAKIAPTILFIDEVDSLLGHRRAVEHEATTAMKTEFMQLWDGFESASDSNIVVLGATNKRDDLDDAVLRRFSLQYEALRALAERTEGYSGSDLTELCSMAAAIPFHDAAPTQSSPAPLSLRHFEAVLAAYTPPSRAAQETQAAKRRGGRGVADLPAREDSMRVLAAMFNSMLGSQQQESEEEGSV